MKTNELVILLATGAGAVRPQVAVRRYALAIAGGLAGALLLMFSLLKVRADLAEAILLPLFWLKIGFVALCCPRACSRPCACPGQEARLRG